jgi:hypothetical protein
MENKLLLLPKINKQDLKSTIELEETQNSQLELWMFLMLLKLHKTTDFYMMKKEDSF